MVSVDLYGSVADGDRIAAVCAAYDVPLVQDAAEAIGAYRDGVHAGRQGQVGVLSFNGNKMVTTGGGGAIMSDDSCDRVASTLPEHAGPSGGSVVPARGHRSQLSDGQSQRGGRQRPAPNAYRSHRWPPAGPRTGTNGSWASSVLDSRRSPMGASRTIG